MKTTLPPRSLIARDRLARVTEEILASAKDKIAMIILLVLTQKERGYRIGTLKAIYFTVTRVILTLWL